MNKLVFFFNLVLCTLFFQPIHFCYADGLRILFSQLQQIDVDYEVNGTICEQAARIMFAKEFPEPFYKIETELEYSNSGRVLGELDLVIFDSHTSKAVLIGEVKCCRHEKNACIHANQQLIRFKRALRSKIKIDFHLRSNHKESAVEDTKFSIDQFDQPMKFVTISPTFLEQDNNLEQQKGHSHSRFDVYLNYTIDELRYVRNLLINFKRRSTF